MSGEIIAVEHRSEVAVFWNTGGEVSIRIGGDSDDSDILSVPAYAVAALARALIQILDEPRAA